MANPGASPSRNDRQAGSVASVFSGFPAASVAEHGARVLHPAVHGDRRQSRRTRLPTRDSAGTADSWMDGLPEAAGGPRTEPSRANEWRDAAPTAPKGS